MNFYIAATLACSLSYAIAAVVCKHSMHPLQSGTRFTILQLTLFLIQNKVWILGIIMTLATNATVLQLQSVLDLNNQYLTIISQLNQLQMNTAAAKTRLDDTDSDTSELEQQLERSQDKVMSLNERVVEICCNLEAKKEELQQVLKRELKYKEMLGLPEEASERQVAQRIKEMAEGGSTQRKELDKVRKELAHVKVNRSQLEDRLTSLTREKDQVEFHIRQQDLTIKRMQRMKTAKETIESAEAMLGGAGHRNAAMASAKTRLPTLSLATVECTHKQLRLQASSDTHSSQYCVLCRKDIRGPGAPCRLHFRALRGGRWLCCQDDCYRSAGCLHTSHLYVEMDPDGTVLLTNGQQYLKLS